MKFLKSKSIRLGLISTIIVHQAAGAEDSKMPICDTSAITRNCEFFKEKSDQMEIKLSDGTSYPNPLYKMPDPLPMAPVQPLPDFSQGGAYGTGFGMGMDYQKYLQEQAEVLDLFEGTDVSNEFRLTLTAILPALAGNPNQVVAVPWPLNQKKATNQQMSIQKVLESLQSVLEKKKFEQLQAITIRKKEESDKLIAEQQKIQQQQELQWKQIQDKQEQEKQKNQNRMQQVRQLFRETQEQVKQLLAHSGLSPAQIENFQNRVDRLKLNDIDPSNPAAACSNQTENAYFDSKGGQITLCPAYLFRPDASIVRVLAHEIGHSIDPCYAQFDTWEVSAENLKKLIQSQSHPKEDLDHLRGLEALNVGFIHQDLELVYPPKLLAEMQKHKVIRKVQDGVPAKETPFRKEYQCFIEKNHFQEITSKDIQQTVEDLRKKAKQLSKKNEKEFSSYLAVYEKAMKKYPQCFRSTRHNSQMGEVMGDMLGALALGKHLEKKPPQNEAEAVGAISYASKACSSDLKDNLTPHQFQVFIPLFADEHPLTSVRLEKIILNQPKVAEIFKCRRVDKSCFEHLFRRLDSPAKSLPPMSPANPTKGTP